jgi:GNAT superfamily N-acetyltransferase
MRLWIEMSPAGGYVLRAEGADAPVGRFDTEEEAEEACRRLALAAVRDAQVAAESGPEPAQVVALADGAELLVRPDLELPHGAELHATRCSTGESVGAARWRRIEGRPDRAEAAVAVTEAWRGRGAGGALLRRLAAHAAIHGVTHFVTPEGELPLEGGLELEDALRRAARPGA